MNPKYILLILVVLILYGKVSCQNTMQQPLDLGSKSQTFYYSDTKNTNDFTNDYTLRSPQDVFYKFSLTTTMDVTISHCGSELNDTYLHILNESGIRIAYNDDYYGTGKCTNSLHSYIRLANLFPGTYYVISEGYYLNGNITTTIEGIKPLPAGGLYDGSAVVSSANAGSNFILTITPSVATSDVSGLGINESIQTVQYFDGLGRPIETVQRGITTTQQDLATFTEYDGAGRDFKHWLPITSTGNGAFVASTNFTSGSTMDYYDYDTKPYTLTKFEASPLNRVLEQYGAGKAWYDATMRVSTYYQTNVKDEVAYFYVNGLNQLQRSGSYDANTLYKTVVADEDVKTTTQYKDKSGQVIMIRSEKEGYVDTYYVYNDLGQLCYVLPPEAVDNLTADLSDNNSIIKQLCYVYKFDERGNCVQKRLPGCDWINMVYDKSNRLVMSQDGNQNAANSGRRYKLWTVTKYDILGRVLYTGTITDYSCSKTREYYKALLDNQVLTENYNGSTTFYNTGYTCSNIIPDITPLTVNYYDTYGFTALQLNGSNLNYVSPPTGYDAQYSNAKGLITGTRTYILDKSGSYLVTAIYYDYRGRAVQTRSTNQLNGFDYTYNHYDFTGNVLNSLKVHNKAGSAVVPEVYTYTYDHAGRPLVTTYQLNNRLAVILTSNSYDELGRLTTKSRHDGTDTEQFEYNIRNWSTKISSGTINTSSMFIEELFYNTNPLNSNFCYNGNISYSTWTYGAVNKGYAYTYDNLNRLQESSFKQGTSTQADGNFDELFTFDKHGNIKTLKRKKDNLLIDNLTLNYIQGGKPGNQVQAIIDAGGSQNLYATKEYQNKSNISYEFNYDQNGNMTKDLDRDIVTIRYNLLNLPDTIQFKNGNQIINRYAADGRKLGTEYFTRITALAAPISENAVCNWVYDRTNIDQSGKVYIDNKEYNTSYGIPANAYLAKVFNPEGYSTSIGYFWFYYRKDHLGNIREVWYANNKTTIQRTQYYPSGLPWAEGYNASLQPFKYNGKEFVEMHGYDCYDYGFRGYYAASSRFTTVDPMAELTPSISPYAYCKGNPINMIDPTGMYSTAEWKEDNGVTDDDLITIYKASSDNNNQEQKKEDNYLIDGFKKEFLNFFGWGLNPDDPNDRTKIDEGSKNRVKAVEQINEANNFLIVNGVLFFVGEGATYCIAKYGGAVLVRIVGKSIGESGITILGRYDEVTGGYAAIAKAVGANYFEVPNWAWNLLSKSDRLVENMKFIDASIARGDAIKLTNSAFDLTQGSFFQEIQHLLARGYKIAPDGMSLFKP